MNARIRFELGRMKRLYGPPPPRKAGPLGEPQECREDTMVYQFENLLLRELRNLVFEMQAIKTILSEMNDRQEREESSKISGN
jgi:hypothetical protein